MNKGTKALLKAKQNIRHSVAYLVSNAFSIQYQLYLEKVLTYDLILLIAAAMPNASKKVLQY